MAAKVAADIAKDTLTDVVKEVAGDALSGYAKQIFGLDTDKPVHDATVKQLDTLLDGIKGLDSIINDLSNAVTDGYLGLKTGPRARYR